MLGQEVFTTGQAARICRVSQRTIIRNFDAGRLKGFRIPGSSYRRIPRECLIKFLKEGDIPYHWELKNETRARVLIIAHDEWLIDSLKRELLGDPSCRVEVAASGFAAGMKVGDFHPNCIVVDFSIGQAEAQLICQNLQRHSALTDIILIALSPADTASVDIDRPVMDEVFTKPFNAGLLAERLRSLLKFKKQQV